MPPAKNKKTKSKKKKLTEVVAIDLAGSSMKLLHAKKSKDDFTVVGIAELPLPEQSEGEEVDRLVLPKEWITYYASLLMPGNDAVIRYVTLPGHHPPTQDLHKMVQEHMGIENEYRVSYVHIDHPNAKTETRLLTAAVKDDQAERTLALLPTGQPAPFSLEIASLAALNAFSEFGPLAQHEDDAIGFIEAGAQITLMALFNKGALTIVRKFNMGGDYLVEHIQKEMGVDREVAQGIVTDGSFDISRSVSAVLGPFLRQLSISKDFIERREDCQLSAIYLSGGMSLSSYWKDDITQTVGVPVQSWNAFENVDVADGAIPENLVGQEPRFTAALGSAWGVFEEL